MRTPILAMFLGLNLVACAGNISGGPGDDDVSATCGNGTMDELEDCDDGNLTDGDGCSATCHSEGVPLVNTSIDKPTVASNLLVDSIVTITFTSVGGFTGPVTITPTVVDAASAPVPGITVAGATQVDLTDGQSAPTQYTVTVASNATGTDLAATVKWALSSSAGTKEVTSTFNVSPTLIIEYKAATGAAGPNHPAAKGDVARNLTVKRGATVGYKNNDTIQHVTHGDGIFQHEDVGAGGQPNGTYMQATIAGAPGQTGNLGCHNHSNPGDYVTFTLE